MSHFYRLPGETDAQMRERVRLAKTRWNLRACPYGHVNESHAEKDATISCDGVAHSYCGQPTYDPPPEVYAAYRLDPSDYGATCLLEEMIEKGHFRPPIDPVPWDQVPR